MSEQAETFRADALAYCELIDSLGNGKPARFYERLAACMIRLAKSAAELPFDCNCQEVEKDESRMTHEAWGEAVAQINHALGSEMEQLIESDHEFPESATRVFMLSDALADIYRDLSGGLDFYQRGNDDGIREAIWQWKFFYEHHWGLHLFDALHTVHRIRYELYEE